MSDHRWPLDRALECLRGHRLPYKWVQEGEWQAVCPMCRSPEWGLSIRECRRGGPINPICKAGCTERQILSALLAEPVDERVERAVHERDHALQLAEEARQVGQEALDLLHREVGRDPGLPLLERRAA